MAWLALTGIQNCNCQVVIKFNAFKPYSIYSSNAYQYAFNCFYILLTIHSSWIFPLPLFCFYFFWLSFISSFKIRCVFQFVSLITLLSIFLCCFGFALFRSNRSIKNMYFCFLRYNDFFFS